MSSAAADERLFDDPAGWKCVHKDARFDQRLRVFEGTFFAETLARIRSSPATVVALLQQPWDWWAKGRIIASTRGQDGALDMDMKPIWWYVVRMSVRVLPAENAPDVRGTRLPILYAGDFDGPGSIDVYPDPSDASRSILRGRCTGVRQHVRMLFATAATVGRAHLLTEAGRFPGARGAGYVGLIRRAEGRDGALRTGTRV